MIIYCRIKNIKSLKYIDQYYKVYSKLPYYNQVPYSEVLQRMNHRLYTRLSVPI